jgi:hypothetical protein
MDDPQLLGHALGIAGVLLVVRKDVSASSIVAAALLMTAASFTKHMLVVQPIAVLFWLARRDQRTALIFAFSGVAFALAGLALTDYTQRTDLIAQLFSPREFSSTSMLLGAGKILAVGLVPICGVVFLFRKRPTDPAVSFAATYVTVAVIAGIFFSGGAGVDSNAMFDAVIAASLVIGLVLKELQGRYYLRSGFAALCFLPLAVGAAAFATPSSLSASHWLSPLKSEQSSSQADVAFLRAAGDPVFCETLALCYWAGLQPEVDVFSFSQAAKSGTRDERDLIRRLDAHAFHAVQMTAVARLPFSQDVKDAFARDYKFHHASVDGVFLVPR